MKSLEKTRQILENWSQQLEYKQVPKRGTEPGVGKGKYHRGVVFHFFVYLMNKDTEILKIKPLRHKRSLLACHTRCKCSMETTRNSVKVKLGSKVMKLVESLDW